MMTKNRFLSVIIVVLLLSVSFLMACDKKEKGPTKGGSTPVEEPAFVFDETDNTYIYMGSYPQSLANIDIVELKKCPKDESTGWYKYEDNWYEIIKATLDEKAVFSNEEEIQKGVEYAFRVEPIKWKVIYSPSDEFLLLSDKVIDATPFMAENKFFKDHKGDYVLDVEVYANNYSRSNLREVMTRIYTIAFSKNQKNKIIEKRLDNIRTNYDLKLVAERQDNTTDCVYALSYKDFFNKAYRMAFDDQNSDTAKKLRIKYGTDYAFAKGAMQVESSTGLKSSYWTRSSGAEKSNWACYLTAQGTMGNNLVVHLNNMGVCPAMSIKRN